MSLWHVILQKLQDLLGLQRRPKNSEPRIRSITLRKKNQTFLCYNTYDLFCVLKLSLLYSWRQQWKGYCPGDMLFRQNCRLPDLAATGCESTELGGQRASMQHRGTVLAPFLFTLYTSDLTYSPSTCHTKNLCDDCDPQPHDWLTERCGLVSAEPRSCWYTGTSRGNNKLHLLWWASSVWTLRGCPPTSKWMYIWTINWTGPITRTLCLGRLRADSSEWGDWSLLESRANSSELSLSVWCPRPSLTCYLSFRQGEIGQASPEG